MGCVYDDWLRIGFSGERGVPDPAHPAAPERVRFGPSRFAFWALTCDATGSGASPRRTAVASRPSSTALASELLRAPNVPESSAWLAFGGEPPPDGGLGQPQRLRGPHQAAVVEDGQEQPDIGPVAQGILFMHKCIPNIK